MRTNWQIRHRAFVAAAIAALALAVCIPLSAHADPIWNRIAKSGKLVCGAIPADPIGSWISQKTHKWEGYEIKLCEAMAAGLSQTLGKTITPVFHETSWPTVVLDIQSKKVDLFPGMSATSQRKEALSMVGPLYNLAFCGLVRRGFHVGDTWEALNNPKVRIATVTGTSEELAFEKAAPKATFLSLPGFAEDTLAVRSGRADMVAADVVRCLSAMKDAPGVFGGILFPEPVITVGSSVGLPKDATKLTSWLEGWSHKEKASGAITKIFLEVISEAGLNAKEIPPNIQF